MAGSFVKKPFFCKAFVLILLALCAFFASCAQSGDSGSPMLSVVLPGSPSARGLLLDGFYERSDVTSFRVSLVGENGVSNVKNVPYGSDAEFFDLTEGVWVVTVEALNAAGIVVARGESVALVVAGESATVSIVLEMVNHIELVSYDLDAYNAIMAGEKLFRVGTSEQFQQLQTLAKDSSKTFEEATILLLNDVESSSDKYLKDFAGTFDGGKHTVTLHGYGLVPGTLTGTVKNVIVDGLVDSSSDIYIGGIAEMTNDATISCCINRATIKYGNGGIVGMIYDGNTVIEQCGNEGTFIPLTESGSNGSGGILGTDMYCQQDSATATIRNCYNIGAVEEHYNAYSGGIVGYASYAMTTIEKCYDMNSNNSYNYDIVGIGPYDTTRLVILNCYSAQQKGTYEKCGTLVTDFSDPSQFVGFDFDNIWEMKDGHPVLRNIQ